MQKKKAKTRTNPSKPHRRGIAIRQRQRRKQATIADSKLAKAIKAGGETALAVLKHKIEVHRLYLYSNLPFQAAVEDHRLRTRNGLNLAGFETAEALARICDLTLGEMSRKYAARN